ncbi:intein/homing endonuclease [Mycolicibacterium rhodesiae NBB3]|uniref:Intein/homing endonuclease n=1 Tax=Mycolicibacterium rhodesiae (strain NBB3) TaxID=710685 RepID=G8RLB9_MYCRN|nr:LAGLIDADG family homing endonuclease [Mycolicibacterium rhodesiae]AEV72381.1 intein/homing endonuclease [Mycolicibacterium rhodesiae NBB3]
MTVAAVGPTKTLPGSARVLLADNGSEVALCDLQESTEQPLVYSMDERLRLVVGRLAAINYVSQAQVSCIRLASGRVVEATADSELRTLAGFLPVRALSIGDRIAAPRRLPPPLNPQSMVADELILLAHMIGDGSCVKRQPIRYASIDEQNLFAVTNAARHFGVTAKRDEYAAARVTTLRLPAPYRLTHGRRNPIAAWLDGMGLFDKRSYEKFVPKQVFGLSNDQVSLFLGHLWATDGCVIWDGKQGQGRIYYASTSRRLMDDVRQLLLRLGILTKAHGARKDGYRVCWQLSINGMRNQSRFLNTVDVNGEKYFAGHEILKNLKGVKANENVDTVPREVWDQVRQGLKDQRMSHRAFSEAMRIKFCGSTMWKHSPSRTRLHRAAAILNDRGLHDLARNDVFWDKIVEITSVGRQDAYRVALAGADNLVAQGISMRTLSSADAAGSPPR